MKNLNWFKYRQYLGYVIDLARIFPIINKHRGVSNFIAGISSHVIEMPHNLVNVLCESLVKANNMLLAYISGWFIEINIFNLLSSF